MGDEAMDKPPEKEVRVQVTAALAMLGTGLASFLGVLVADAAWMPLVAGITAAVALAVGIRLGDRHRARVVRMRLYRVSDELVQYGAFTRLLRSQGDRITDLTGDAAMVIAQGLNEMDERAVVLARRLEGASAADLPALRDEAAAITTPIVTMVGKLQFQDVTRQQLMFLSRLSLLLDDHIGELCRMLGDRRSLARTARFKELFDAALDETVMASQRNDHHDAAGLDFIEQSGPAVEMFAEEGEPR